MNGGPGMTGRQSGFALIVGLVVLVLLTLIMLMALRMASLEERMAGNLRNQNIAFQAAESALREAEGLIRSGAASIDWDGDGTVEVNPFNPLDLYDGPFQESENPVCVDGLCQRNKLTCEDGPCESAPPPSHAFSTMGDGEVRVATLELPSNAFNELNLPEPEYIIELLPIDWSTDDRRRFVTFRITARARGEDPNSLVQLESTYRAHIPSFID